MMKKCPLDGRQFRTEAALQQHKRDAHPAGAKSRKGQVAPPARSRSGPSRMKRTAIAPVAVAGYRAPPQSDTLVVSGSDILAVVTVPKTASTGRVIADLVINPRHFQGTRLTQLAGLYTRWRPVKLELIVQAAVPTTVGGQIAMGWAADPNEDWPNSVPALVRKVNTLRPSVMFHLWEVGSMRIPSETVQKWLYCAEEGPDSDHGRVAVVLTAAPTSATGPFGITIRLNWTVHYQSPDLPVTGALMTIRAREGYYPYFTTGSRFQGDSKYLTCECVAAGGANSVVEFAGIQLSTIYAPVQADQLKYYDEKSELQNVAAIARCRDTPEDYAYCFASVADADEYVKSGTLAKVIPYTKAGPWCVGNPLWTAKSSLTLPPLVSNVGGSLQANDLPELDIIETHVRDNQAQATAVVTQAVVDQILAAINSGLAIKGSVKVRNSPAAPLYVLGARAESSSPFETFSDGDQ